jgi:hypothetical protein|tara:strand:+ start:1404 stop:2153 length:750 start_codon:yes stop_codon:yes gene_type:complete
MTIHVTPIPRLIDLAAPAFTLGTANVAGSAETSIASDSTLLAFDTTNPTAVAASAAVGSATVASRRDHVHSGITVQSSLVFIGTDTSGSTREITGLSSTYQTYLITIENVTTSVEASNAMLFAVGDSSGFDTAGGDYSYHCQASTDAATTYVAISDDSAAYIYLNPVSSAGIASGEGFSAVLYLDIGNGTTQPKLTGETYYNTTTGAISGGVVLARRTAGITLDRIQLTYNTGTGIQSGTMSCWGIRKS